MIYYHITLKITENICININHKSFYDFCHNFSSVDISLVLCMNTYA